MKNHFSEPEQYMPGMDTPVNPSVKVKIDASTGDVSFEIPADINLAYLKGVLATIMEGLQNNGDEKYGDGGRCCSDSPCVKEYDVFISHASEDKQPLVEELVGCLKTEGIRVWYDKDNIDWGDRFRAKIDEGLEKAQYGIIILSPDYIRAEKYWTKAELDALIQIESATGRKVLLPVWHHLSKNEVIAFSPLFASRSALNTATMTIAEIAANVKKIISDDS